MTFWCYHVPSILVARKDFMTRFQIRMEDEERQFWQEYANRYFRGNLAKMIRTLVTQQIMSAELEKDTELPDELVDAIIEIKTSSKETTETVGSFQSDLIIMKSLLTQIINKQVVGVNPIDQEPQSPNELLKEEIRQYLEKQEEFVELEDVLKHLKNINIVELDESDRFTVSIFLDEIREDLFQQTKEGRFWHEGGNQFDF